GEVELVELDLPFRTRDRHAFVETGARHLVPTREQRAGEVLPDEARDPGDEDAHANQRRRAVTSSSDHASTGEWPSASSRTAPAAPSRCPGGTSSCRRSAARRPKAACAPGPARRAPAPSTVTAGGRAAPGW